MKIVKHYFKDKLKIIGLFMICSCIFMFVFKLYQLELEAIVYSCYLCAIFLGSVMIFDFIQYVKKHEAMQTNLEIAWLKDHHLIKDDTLIGKDYQQIIHYLSKQLHDEMTKADEDRKSLEDYYSLWVHQIKLPIAAIKLLLETQESLDKRLLKSELFRIDQYVNMVLTYLRMNSIDTDYHFAKYDIDNIIRPIIRKFSNEFIRKKIRLNYTENHTSILTDDKWLSFIIEQLLSNALKYTEKGFINIYMEDDQKLIIEDSGIGIDACDIPRIFEKGYTGFNGRYDKKASGIGLYLCQNIAEHLSHQIKIQSQKNIGTKAVLYLGHYDLKVE